MSNKKICIVTWGGIGDHICVTPSLKAIYQKCSTCEITLVTESMMAEVFFHNPYIYNLIYTARDSRRLWREKDKFDYIFKLEDPAISKKQIMKKTVIANRMDLDVAHIHNEIYLTKKEINEAHLVTRKLKIPILFHPSSSSQKKNWFTNRWEDLIGRLRELNFLQIGLTSDPYINGATDFRGKTNIRQAIALLATSKLFVGTDSFLNHATDATGTNGVVLFGPSQFVKFSYKENFNIHKQICQPCGSDVPCEYNFKCMQAITVDEVEIAIRKQLIKVNY